MLWWNACVSVMPQPGGGEYTSRRLPGRSTGLKNGRPWTWSQCRWVTSATASQRLVGGQALAVEAQAGAEVEQDRWSAGRLDDDRGCVPAVACVGVA